MSGQARQSIAKVHSYMFHDNGQALYKGEDSGGGEVEAMLTEL